MGLELYSDKKKDSLALVNNIKLAIAAAAFGLKFSPEPGMSSSKLVAIYKDTNRSVFRTTFIVIEE